MCLSVTTYWLKPPGECAHVHVRTCSTIFITPKLLDLPVWNFRTRNGKNARRLLLDGIRMYRFTLQALTRWPKAKLHQLFHIYLIAPTRSTHTNVGILLIRNSLPSFWIITSLRSWSATYIIVRFTIYRCRGLRILIIISFNFSTQTAVA